MHLKLYLLNDDMSEKTHCNLQRTKQETKNRGNS